MTTSMSNYGLHCYYFGLFLKRKKMFQHHFVLICSFIMIMRGFSQCLTHRFCITFTGFSNVEEEVLGYFSSTFQKFKLGQSVAKRKLTSMTHPRDFSLLSYYVGQKWDSRIEVQSWEISGVLLSVERNAKSKLYEDWWCTCRSPKKTWRPIFANLLSLDSSEISKIQRGCIWI